jgi:hypothetical protein
MKRLARLGALILVASFAWGCTSMNVTQRNDQAWPALPEWRDVEVYDDASEVGGAYEEVAVIEVTSAATRGRMLRDCQRRAAELGANAIVIERAGTHGQMQPIVAGSVTTFMWSDRWDGRIVAIHVAE